MPTTTVAARTDRIELRASREEKRLLAAAAALERLAKNDEAAHWYGRFGAQPLLDDPLKLILPLAVVADALASSGTRP